MILHENRLPADDSHEISLPYLLFLKRRQNFKLSSAANQTPGALWVNSLHAVYFFMLSLS